MLARPERKKRSVLQYEDLTKARAFLDKNMSKDARGLWQWDNGLTSAKAAACLGGPPFTVGNISHLREKYKGTSRHFKQKVAPAEPITLAEAVEVISKDLAAAEEVIKNLRDELTRWTSLHSSLAFEIGETRRDCTALMEWATRQGYVKKPL